MMEKQIYFEQLALITRKYDEADDIISFDKIRDFILYKPEQELKLKKFREIYKYLKTVDFDVLFMNLVSESRPIEVTNGLVSAINAYDDKVLKKKFINDDIFLNKFFNDLPLIKDLNSKIVYLKREIEDIKNLNPLMEDWEKNKLISECQEEINLLEKQKSDIDESSAWIKTNYFSKIFLLNGTVMRKINTYFSKKPNIDRYFDISITSDLFEELFKLKIIKPEKGMSVEDFHEILNYRKPNIKCVGALKASHFGSIFKEMKNRISKLGLNEESWEIFVLKELGVKKNTMYGHARVKDDYKKIYEIINPKCS